MKIYKSNAIQALGSWECSMSNADLSTLKFYTPGTADEIPKPANFPTDEVINAKVISLQAVADAGNYDSVQEVIAADNA